MLMLLTQHWPEVRTPVWFEFQLWPCCLGASPEFLQVVKGLCAFTSLETMKGLMLQRFFFYILFIYWLLWVFVAVHGLSLVAVSGGYSLVEAHGVFIAFSCSLPHDMWSLS